MHILGIDPGIKTGYVLLEVRSPSEFHKVAGGTAKGYDGVKRILELLPVPDICVIEDFTLWPALAEKVAHDDPELLTTRYIGALTYMLRHVLGLRVVLQQPAFKKACPDYLLEQFGLWNNASSPHERDAMRHVVVLARREYAAADRERKKRPRVRDVVDWQGDG